jgi:Domain of unknown function (DUF4386)
VSTAGKLEAPRRISPRVKARVAGAFYLLAVLTAVAGEGLAHARPAYVLGLLAVACYVVVTLLVYDLFKAVNREVSLLAAACNLVGLALEALRWQPGGTNVAMVFHGSFCVLIGYLIVRSSLMPRVLGALLVFAGVAWLIYLSPQGAHNLAPYNTIVGLLGEGLPFLWMLVMGVRRS